jgi:hypothetical protein
MNPPSHKAWNRPIAREGPHVPYKNDNGSNPVLRGYALAVVSKMYHRLPHSINSSPNTLPASPHQPTSNKYSGTSTNSPLLKTSQHFKTTSPATTPRSSQYPTIPPPHNLLPCPPSALPLSAQVQMPTTLSATTQPTTNPAHSPPPP